MRPVSGELPLPGSFPAFHCRNTISLHLLLWRNTHRRITQMNQSISPCFTVFSEAMAERHASCNKRLDACPAVTRAVVEHHREVMIDMKNALSPMLLVLPFAVLLAASAHGHSSDSSSISLPLQNTGIDADADGKVAISLRSSSSVFGVTVSKLDANRAYAVQIGTIVQGQILTDKKGSGRISFKTKSASNPLDFDPRGETIMIHDGTNAMLQAVVSSAGEPAGSDVSERTQLQPQVPGDLVKGRAEYRARKDGRREFRVKVERFTNSVFELFVGGVKRGDLRLSGREAKIDFSTNPKGHGLLLDFDPRGQVVDVVQAGVVRLSGVLAAKAMNVNVALPSTTILNLPSTGVDADGTARARLRVRENARKDFSIEVEGVPAGDYELVANDNVAGVIRVLNSANGTEGEIEFNAGDDHPDGELPLTFDPVGAHIVIRQGATVYFDGVFSSSSGGTGTTGGSGNNGSNVVFPPETAGKIEENLTRTGVISGASGDAKYEIRDNGRRKFSVEIEDVPTGDYSLRVGGDHRGTIRVVTVVGGTEGEIEFNYGDDHPDGELPLTFDPRGKLIEVVNDSGTVIFSHTFGGGSAPGGSTGSGTGSGAGECEVKLPLISTGADSNASAEAKFRRKAGGDEDLEVEIEDVVVGAYELLVGGEVRATIQVVTVEGGTRGKVEFDSDSPQAGELLLNFPVAGQEIVIRQGGTSYFSRVMPVK